MKHLLKSREIAGFGVLESLYPPKLRQPRHTHTLASFSFVLAGSYMEKYDAQSQMRQSSTIVFHPPQESHAVDFQSEVRILSVQVDSKKLNYLRERAIVFDSSASGRTKTICWLGHRLYQEFCRTDSVSALAIEGLIFEILAEAFRARDMSERNSPRWLDQAEDFLRDHFSESVVFDDVAKIAGVHPVHLARVFRKKHGCTIGEYLRRLRVEFACRQISTTDTLLGEIAHAAGFADQSHLTKTFKHHFGLTPSQYRKMLG